jgi:transposase
MYAREHRVLLRHYLEQGLSKTAIARTLHVSRRTVYHWMTTGQLVSDRGNTSSRMWCSGGAWFGG